MRSHELKRREESHMPPVLEAVIAIVFLVVVVFVAGACLVGFSKVMETGITLASRLFR